MKPLALLALLLTSGTLAATRVAGTNTVYSYSLDPISDVNTSVVAIDEQYDQYGDTRLTVQCANRGEPDVWAALRSKNDLITEGQLDQGLKPAVTIRLGNDPAITLRDSDLVSVVDERDNLKTRSLGFYGPVVGQLVRGLQSGKRLAVRINRPSGGQALTYLFPAAGFNTAWSGVRGCGGAASAVPARSMTQTSSSGVAAPKFTQWYFTTCRDAESGVVRTGLIAGRAHLCDLVIDTVPNGNFPTSARFNYELEYRENGQAGKLKLGGADGWQTGSENVKFRREGSKLVFTLPLNVRARSNRVYTSLNVIGELDFGGVSKKVFEPLPVRSGN
ncbi:hypothetical protein EHF33_00150 [Deinococcus psychrotolerans]|uniref:Uncharacterized protein n=1 Tax=Deinococcus psychrotolerans TaxID=2489213 RepID=A0A3G8YFP9_9DEIO|nr:hypothetical protein [Deinococcus psychrotolerans]AZI41354.1 hypothetical protein EHF33_00150 [Deinococcus psychrotolerans]